MVALMAPRPDDTIVDPAFGTAGFLVGAGEHVRDHYADALSDQSVREHFDHRMFHGFDSDATMLRIGSMNMLMHGVENPDLRRKDSPAEEYGGDAGQYSLVLANPPFVDLAPSGPDLMFPSDKVDRLVILLDDIRANAMAV